VIMSHKRAGAVTTQRFVSNCLLCVPESQAAGYAKAHPQLEQLVHPDSVIGLWAKREWVRRELGDHVQLDDDCIGCYRVYRSLAGWKKSVLGPDRAYELIQMTADRARKLGAYLFGFAAHAKPLTYNGLKPFRFGGYTPGGCLGVLEGAKFWWPTDTDLADGDDYWVCLLNAHLHRFCFFDRRFAFAFKDTYVGAGGLAEFRAGSDGQAEMKDGVLEYLQKAFGDRVVVRNYDKGNVATKKIKNPARRSIKMPYRT